RPGPPKIAATPPPSTWRRRPTRTWPSCGVAWWATTPCAPASKPRGWRRGPIGSCWKPTWSWWDQGREDRSSPRSSRDGRSTGCGFCDLGCRYNRKLTPLNVVLPLAARHGAQVLANCRIDELLLEKLPDDGRDGRTHRVTGVVGWLTDSRGTDRERVEIRARRVVLAAGPFSSPRILMRSHVPHVRSTKGA